MHGHVYCVLFYFLLFYWVYAVRLLRGSAVAYRTISLFFAACVHFAFKHMSVYIWLLGLQVMGCLLPCYEATFQFLLLSM